MKHGISLGQVYDAMKAGGPLPITREGMRAALDVAGLWDEDQPARVDIALSAYGLLGPAGSAESDMQRALEAVAQFIAPKPSRSEVKQAEVTEAARAYVAEPDALGVFEPDHQLVTRLRKQLGIDYELAGNAWQQRAAEGRFARQVKAALDKLTTDGTLIKVGAGLRGPDGQSNYRNQVRYFTPGAWAAAERETAKRQSDDQALEARATEVMDGLSELGIYARPRNEWIYLDLESAERLLGMVHASRSLPTHVTFAHPDAGYEAAREKACAALVPGQAYILKTLRVERSYSTVELATVEGVPVPGQYGTEFFEIHDPGPAE